MKSLKLISLAVVAFASLMISAGSASATTLTSPTGVGVTPTIQAAHEGTHISFHNQFVAFRCNSNFTSTVQNHGSGITASGPVSVFSLTNCTDNVVADVVTKGTLEVHHTSGSNGTLTSTGLTITATFIQGFSCSYTTNNTHIGTITGGNPATMHISASMPRHAGSFLCGNVPINWTGSYTVTSPGSLYVDP